MAQKEGIKPEELQTGIDLFVAAVRANPDADRYALALVEFTEKNFSQAAATAGQVAEEAKKRRLAAQ